MVNNGIIYSVHIAKDGIVYSFPDNFRDRQTNTTRADLLCGEWEVVHPDEVLGTEEV